ncbi:MAG: hypothetical protein K6D94_08985 [Clostridiales bacterium]|nr:hypothetical protein [Clostridiales bacterium]
MKIPNNGPAIYEYEIFPAVALKGTPTEFAVRGLGIQKALEPGIEYIIRVLPQEENISSKTLEISDYNRYEGIRAVCGEDGYLRFRYTFNREQIYTLRLIGTRPDGSAGPLTDLRIFCAEKDLYIRTPMRGNTHCHTCMSSDGSEDPYLAAATYRRAGFDYLAITDHHNAMGSVYAVAESRDIPTEMSFYYGEEVHVPNPYIHAVNVGALMPGDIGLDKWYHEHEYEVKSEVAKTAESCRDTLPPGIEPYDYAWRRWIADTIHSRGGVAILAHPFWEYDAHNTRDDMFRLLAKEKIYDAAEIAHGQEPGCSDANLQLAFWNDMRAEGISISPVGVDDAHRRYFSWNYDSSFNEAYTVIFALDPSFGGFAEAVKGGYSAAVESYEKAPEHIIASYRLTKYTAFLFERYFPLHDELCFEEGCSMRDCYLGSGNSRDILSVLNGRVKRFTDRFFGRVQL